MKDIICTNLSKAFENQSVLQDFNHTFAAGTITCIIGESGCGKTTLLNLLAGLVKPDAGTIDGVPEKIAYVFQEDRLCEDFNAIANIRLVCGNMKKESIIQQLQEILPEENLFKPVGEYSGGMKRRVAIARAVCYDADCILLDEPFKGLDEELKNTVMDYVLKNAAGKTVICVTHDREEAAYLGGSILELKRIEQAE